VAADGCVNVARHHERSPLVLGLLDQNEGIFALGVSMQKGIENACKFVCHYSNTDIRQHPINIALDYLGDFFLRPASSDNPCLGSSETGIQVHNRKRDIDEDLMSLLEEWGLHDDREILAENGICKLEDLKYMKEEHVKKFGLRFKFCGLLQHMDEQRKVKTQGTVTVIQGNVSTVTTFTECVIMIQTDTGPSSPVRVREMSQEDLMDFLPSFRESFGHQYKNYSIYDLGIAGNFTSIGQWLSQVALDEAQSYNRKFVVRDERHDNVLVGYVSLKMLYGIKVAYLAQGFVVPEYQKKGLAKTFFAKVIDSIVPDSVTLVTLLVRKINENAIEAYKRIGFKELSPVVKEEFTKSLEYPAEKYTAMAKLRTKYVEEIGGDLETMENMLLVLLGHVRLKVPKKNCSNLLGNRSYCFVCLTISADRL
jgi:ribosomal protein S18 acetylase RimI-like enzyme